MSPTVPCACGNPSVGGNTVHRAPPEFCYITVIKGFDDVGHPVDAVVELPALPAQYSPVAALVNFPVLQGPPQPNLLDDTTEFMSLGGQLDGEQAFPQSWSDDLRKLRRDLLSEEIHEYFDGEDRSNLTEIVDGLLDIVVIAWGTLLAYVGPVKAKAAAAEVARSNLSKVDGSLGPIVRREDGKLLKPQGWTAPDIAGAIR